MSRFLLRLWRWSCLRAHQHVCPGSARSRGASCRRRPSATVGMAEQSLAQLRALKGRSRVVVQIRRSGLSGRSPGSHVRGAPCAARTLFGSRLGRARCPGAARAPFTSYLGGDWRHAVRDESAETRAEQNQDDVPQATGALGTLAMLAHFLSPASSLRSMRF